MGDAPGRFAAHLGSRFLAVLGGHVEDRAVGIPSFAHDLRPQGPVFPDAAKASLVIAVHGSGLRLRQEASSGGYHPCEKEKASFHLFDSFGDDDRLSPWEKPIAGLFTRWKNYTRGRRIRHGLAKSGWNKTGRSGGMKRPAPTPAVFDESPPEFPQELTSSFSMARHGTSCRRARRKDGPKNDGAPLRPKRLKRVQATFFSS